VSVRLTRRELLAAGAAGGAGLALHGLGPSVMRALAAPPVCGTLNDIQHVVILIQENRSFDHYFGTYRGVRGFADPNMPTHLVGGQQMPIYFQSDSGRTPPFGTPSGFLSPFHIDSFHVDPSNSMGNGECTNDITHEWAAQHSAWNAGAMDQFLKVHLQADPVNGPMTMGYCTRADLDYYYALADNFTLCDGYHCSVIGPTDPNRLYAMTATLDPAGANGGPWLQTLVTNRQNSFGTLGWTTYPEQLQAKGVTWKVYSSADGHYGDNVLPYFKKYFGSSADSTLVANGLAPTFPGEFETDCAGGTLPQVSWVLAPLVNSEHPPAPPVWGEWVTAQVLNALTSSSVWDSTVLFVTWDENGGFFDHVPPPTPPAGTAGEYITVNPLPTVSPRDAGGIAGPIGLGFRVPLLVCSPFARGGYVSHDVFDHTSLLLFLERRFGAEVPNITQWRRDTVGDLTSALNMAVVDSSVPSITQPSLADPRAVGPNPPSDCPTSAPSDLIDSGLPTVDTYGVPQPNTSIAVEGGAARVPSGLSCTPSPRVPGGPPVLLVASAAAAVAGAGAFARRRARLRSDALQE